MFVELCLFTLICLLFQPIAVEIFCTDGQNHLLAFSKAVRAKAYQRFLTTATSISDCAQMSVAGQRRSANVEQGSGILSSLMGECPDKSE